MKVEHIAGTEFLDNESVKADQKLEIITEGFSEKISEEKTNQLGNTIDDKLKEEPKLSKFLNWMGDNWEHFINWIKKSISMMIIFVLIGGACGLYLAKILYDMRMDEISILAKTGVAGYVHKGQIFDVKLRP